MAEQIPVVAPEEAISFFRAKGYKVGFAWQDVWQEEHARAFTVAKAMSRDLLEDIRAEVDRALSEGRTLQQFREDLRPRLQARGWWGRKRMIDPLTGENKVVQLGSPRRLRTIFQVNMRTAYHAGRWERIQRTKAALPLLRYVSVMDGRERAEHHAWHGTILPIDHPWWQSHYPPCGWNCRCTTQSLNQRMVDRGGWKVTDKPASFPAQPYLNKRTGEITKVERGIDPGWAYNVGEAHLGGLAPAPIGADAPATDAKITAFLAPFEVAQGGERVFKDREGWPHAISESWFRNAGGQLHVPAGATPEQLARAADTIINPDAIVWRWVIAADGRQLLMRRYLKRGVGTPPSRVDIGGAGWRFAIGRKVVAANIPDAAAELDRFVERSMASATASPHHVLGPIGDTAAVKLVALGLAPTTRAGAAKAIALDASLVRHIQRRHGDDGDGRRPIGAADYRRLPRILDQAHSIQRGDPPRSRSGAARVVVESVIDGSRYTVVFELRRRELVPITMWKR